MYVSLYTVSYIYFVPTYIISTYIYIYIHIHRHIYMNGKGVLGCMAERLKDKLLDEDSVDFVCEPDACRDMPRLINNS